VTKSVFLKKNGETLFHIKTDNPERVKYPVPSFETIVSKVENDLDLVHRVYAVHAPEEVHFDGTLEDWKDAESIPLIYAHGFDPEKNPEDLQSEIRFMWDEYFLYVAIDTIDNEHVQPYSGDIVWAADNVELFMDKCGN